VGEDEERLPRDGCELHDHAIIPLRIFFDEQAEDEAVRSIDLEVFPGVLDCLCVPLMHDPESSAEPRIDLHLDRGPDPARGESRPCRGGLEPGIKDPFG
jgi:hypothetical protein